MRVSVCGRGHKGGGQKHDNLFAPSGTQNCTKTAGMFV